MKSIIIKLVALIALMAGGFSISAQNNKTSSTAFAIDKNIISFEVANLVDKRISEHPSEPGWGSPEAFSPHFWTITLFMNVKISSNDQNFNVNQSFDIRLFDSFGTLKLQTATNSSNTQINVSNLPNGIYFLHVYDNVTRQLMTQTIIIRH